MAKTPFGPVNRVRNLHGQFWFVERENLWHLGTDPIEETWCGVEVDPTGDRPSVTFQERWVVVAAICPDCYEHVLQKAQERRLK